MPWIQAWNPLAKSTGLATPADILGRLREPITDTEIAI
jgi:hypothetical protein